MITEDLQDPTSDPDNPRRICFAEITAAAYRIRRGPVRFTECSKSQLSDVLGFDIWIKKEFTQTTGSFKERGARNAMLRLSDEQKENGIIAASLGNHGLGVARHGSLLGLPTTIVMPKTAPIFKIQRCINYGANVIVDGDNMGEAKQIALEMARDKCMYFINGYDNPDVIAGNGTVGLEVIEQAGDDIAAVVIPFGGGGLAAGTAVAIKECLPNCKVITVETENCASFQAALDNCKPTAVEVVNTIADGLAVPIVGYNAFHTIKPLVDKHLVVNEDLVCIGLLRLTEYEKVALEGASGSAIAALMSGQMEDLKGQKVVCICSGGNIDITTFSRVIQRGLACDFRLIRFSVIVSDRPGGLSELTCLLGSMGCSIKELVPQKTWIADLFQTQMICVCETRNVDHARCVIDALLKAYPGSVRFHDTMQDNASALALHNQRIGVSPIPNELPPHLGGTIKQKSQTNGLRSCNGSNSGGGGRKCRCGDA